MTSLLDHLGITAHAPDPGPCRKGDPENHRITPPVTDLWTAAVYIERDGARMVSHIPARRQGLRVFHGPAGPGCYTFTVKVEDLDALSVQRDRAHAKYSGR